MMKNIILIGMPAVGKSTVGVILAKILGYKFIDTDLVIQETENRLLSEIILSEGIDGFIETENRIVSQIDARKSVIATGGSVVYGEKAMKHLTENGIAVYLELEYNELKKRLSNISNRGVVIRKEQNLSELFKERSSLYEKYADIVINENDCSIEETTAKIIDALNNDKKFN